MSTLAFSDREFQAIRGLMYETVGLSFNDSKKSLIQSRLSARVQRLGLEGFGAYVDLLHDEAEAAEFQMAVDLLTTNETYFFREPKHFEVLQREVVGWGPLRNVAAWSAAASFGDEAYSIAMLLADLQTKGQTGAGWSILATDISHRVLLSAKEGIFPQDRLHAVTPQQRKRYCLRGEGPSEGQIQIQEPLRNRVQFGQLNLCKPFDGLGPFDVLFLRNVLIYFDAATKVEVVDRVLSTLRPGGLFFLGTAEGRVPCKTALLPLVPGAFRKPA